MFPKRKISNYRREEQSMSGKRFFSRAQLRRLIIPLLVEQLLVMLVGMLDTVMVSSAGEAAVSGVSIVNEVNYLVITILSALAAGGAVIVSQYIGNRDQKNSSLSASQLTMISFVISTVLMIVCLVFCRSILNTLYGSVAPDVMEAAVTYFWITALSFPFLGVYNSISALYRSMNETKVTMFVSIIMNVINIVGNYFGVYVFHMGVAGVAWPTLISRAVAAVIIGVMSLREENQVRVVMKDVFMFRWDIIQRILNIAIPNAIENGLFQVGRVIVTIFISGYGTSQIAANGVANSFSTLAIISSAAMQLAIVTVVGQCVGANDYDQAQYYMKHMMITAYIMGLFNNILVLLIMPYGLQLYTLTPETARIVTTIMYWNALATTLLHPMSFVLPNALRAAGDARFTMIVGIVSMFATRISLAFVFGTVLKMYVLGTYFAMFCDWVTRIICFVWRWKSGRWKNFRAI